MSCLPLSISSILGFTQDEAILTAFNCAVQVFNCMQFPCCVNPAGGREENTVDSVLMLWNSDGLNAVNTLFFWSVVGLNVFGLMVTQVLGSVFRAVMLTARTASVRHPAQCLVRVTPDLKVRRLPFDDGASCYQ